MHQHWHSAIPTTMSGYTILAAVPRLTVDNPLNPTSDDPPPSFTRREFIILGMDPSRARPKYVVGTVFIPYGAMLLPNDTEWAWGDYTENAAKAAQVFMNRAGYNITTPTCEGCEDPTWSLNRKGFCPNCTKAALRADRADGGSRLESVI